MKLAKILTPERKPAVAMIEEDHAKILSLPSGELNTLADILNSNDPAVIVSRLAQNATKAPLDQVTFRSPVDEQETWAAGVTYKRSQVARMEESESGATHYDKVYTADRPELFFKATPNRVVHPGEPVRVRNDSKWTVPEPEFTLVLNPKLEIVGYTIGNDMSARDIEGENPLYLPQAKVYRQCCALGPVIRLASEPLDRERTRIILTIKREGQVIVQDETNLGQMHRTFSDLASWLGRQNEFPHGAFLLTGTGIIPADDFSLENGDEISIEVTDLGTLTNPVVKDPE